MSAKDIFHEAVKRGLQKQGWVITHDPLVVKFAKDKMSVDLGAEKILAAERGTEKLLLRLKVFWGIQNCLSTTQL